MMHPPCNCSVCRGRATNDLVANFAYKDNGEIEKPGLRYLARLHDHQSDQEELSRVTKVIKSHEMKEYKHATDLERERISKMLI